MKMVSRVGFGENSTACLRDAYGSEGDGRLWSVQKHSDIHEPRCALGMETTAAEAIQSQENSTPQAQKLTTAL